MSLKGKMYDERKMSEGAHRSSCCTCCCRRLRPRKTTFRGWNLPRSYKKSLRDHRN